MSENVAVGGGGSAARKEGGDINSSSNPVISHRLEQIFGTQFCWRACSTPPDSPHRRSCAGGGDTSSRLPPQRQWHALQELGTGSYGTVESVVEKENGFSSHSPPRKLKENVAWQRGQVYARKKYRIKNSMSDKALREIAREIHGLRESTCACAQETSNVAKFIDYDVDEHTGQVSLVMEAGRGGTFVDLAGRLRTEHDALVLLHGALCGLECLHRHNIAHNDLKPDNFVLRRTPCEIAKSSVQSDDVMIVDFGLACDVEKSAGASPRFCSSCNVQEYEGTIVHFSPEKFAAVRGSATDPNISKSSDIWALALSVLHVVNPDLHQNYVNSVSGVGLGVFVQSQTARHATLSEIQKELPLRVITSKATRQTPALGPTINEALANMLLYHAAAPDDDDDDVGNNSAGFMDIDPPHISLPKPDISLPTKTEQKCTHNTTISSSSGIIDYSLSERVDGGSGGGGRWSAKRALQYVERALELQQPHAQSFWKKKFQWFSRRK